MSPVHDEHTFGNAIVAAMLDNGWRQGNPHEYRPEFGLDTGELFGFIGTTQSAE
jgi:type I restriction enzyme R subunit